MWTNRAVRVYHGTSEPAARSIVKSGVNLSLGRGAADFGRGFYVTSYLHQAQQWANQKVRSLRGVLLKAAVVEFDLDRDKIGAMGDHLTFVLPDKSFHDFVVFNRLGGARHSRSKPKGEYDVVYGPVAAFPQSITYANCDQICFLASGINGAIKALGKALPLTHIASPYFP